ncbi:uncharacterized protein TNCT_333791 [Trichonephila clavata]|uniref:C2H2-type domain-containing protein n=1 Tax=Trichonephila clavata TaxID=2740835 RepID=A0A8X6J3I6_TRICU|nr:uncharacterized protein TNCT_333791 [Trichonephila clavata]
MPKNSRKSCSQPAFSLTPRRHLRGSPIAHRTRRQISFLRAVQIGLCKICYRVLPDMQSLWDHIKSAHSPSAKQQCCLNSFPTEFHFDANLAKANAWEIFFGTTSCPQLKHNDSPACAAESVLNSPDPSCSPIKQCVSPEHSSVPDFSTLDLSLDAVEKGLMSSFSQPTASVPDVSVVPSSDRCVPDQVGSQTVDTGSPIPLGLSHSWCAPIPVYTNPSAQLKGPEHSKSLPLNLISVQCDSPISPTVSSKQIQVIASAQSECMPVEPDSPIAKETGGSLSDLPCGVLSSVAQVENLPTVHTVCEIQAKTRSPPQPKSPDILEIVLGGDISLPESPDFVQLREAWLGKLNGSPPHPAFPPPSFAQVVSKKASSAKNVLLPCNKCDRRFYTTHGLDAHVCKNQLSEDPSVPSKDLHSSGPPSKPKRPREPLPPRLRKKSVKTQTVVCLFCEKQFKTLAALSQHSLVVHGEVAQQRVNSTPGASVASTSGKQCVSTSGNASTETPPLFRCPECGFIAKSKKGLFYHAKEAHKKPSPPLTVAGTASDKSSTQLPLSISGKTIQISLPVADIIPCPFDQCRQTFATGNWDGACDRIKNHFANAHGTGGCKLYQFCSLCRKGFFENPVEHSCLKGGYIIESAPPLPKRHTKLACSSSTAETVTPPVEDLIVERTVSVKQSFPSSPPVAGIDLHGDTLRYFFPTPQTMCCPVSGCSHSFTTKKWFTTNTSIKRHLTSFHRRPNLFVQYWCSSCRKRIVQPARHRCLKGASLVTRSSQGTWECEDCQFKASTKVGLDNHRKTHRREAAVLELPQLTVPETSSKKAKKKKARMAPLSSGDPGSARLAPPASPLAADPPCPEQNEDTAEGRADLAVPAVLEGFVEALDTLLEVDGISDSMPHLETLVDNLVVVVQEHFHLSRPPQNQNSTTANRPTDVQNPQAVQRNYRWNRRKCIRLITQANSLRCPLPREAVTAHFQQVWEHAKTDVIEQSQNPPTRPPVVEALARSLCLNASSLAKIRHLGRI